MVAIQECGMNPDGVHTKQLSIHRKTLNLKNFINAILTRSRQWWIVGQFRQGHRMAQSLEAQLLVTLNVIPASMWYATPSGGLILVNERAADYGGSASDHPLRHGTDTSAAWDSHLHLLHSEDQEETRRVWSECLRTGRPCEVSVRARNAEGDYRWFLSRAGPLRANDETILYWIAINLEVEERKQAEVEVRRSKWRDV